MRLQKIVVLVIIAIVLFSCKEKENRNPLLISLSSQVNNIKIVMDSIENYEVQIRYTQIDRKNDSIIFTDYDFQVDENNYFYPASTVKFPAAVAALEKLNELDTLGRNTAFYVEGDSVNTTIAKAVSEIFAVSDNQANNRLVEFLGFDDLNNRVKKKGLRPFRISHRLSTRDADEVTTKPLVIYVDDSTTATSESIINAVPKQLDLNLIKKGIGFYAGDSLYEEPFDFSYKNYFPVNTQHELLKKIIFPSQFSENERFNLNEDQYSFLLEAMHTLPKNAGYNEEEYYDSYGKFLMYGDRKDPIPNHIEIYNKVGYAYGTLTDCAYIKDTKNNLDFMVTATILVNRDGIFNDDKYEYDEIGIPFLAQLGRELYNHELKRKR
ncbi:serine hydrolase [Croceitalea rosinachiae]|uniref:Serine hydrolase n=1 Tax=Croceitalea rosinachiae TaxID=3075596 RepID=A0ABU3ADP0_9FLAO|nr:serine hydrolase [Croceitalea sp. F388]MDT0608301.1 serine hydrolase [Croceitalea sp. F388]